MLAVGQLKWGQGPDLYSFFSLQMWQRCFLASSQGLSHMKDGTIWATCDDAVLAVGLLKWGQSPGLIAADLLPGFTVEQVAQRILERTHRQRPANVVKVFPSTANERIS